MIKVLKVAGGVSRKKYTRICIVGIMMSEDFKNALYSLVVGGETTLANALSKRRKLFSKGMPTTTTVAKKKKDVFYFFDVSFFTVVVTP